MGDDGDGARRLDAARVGLGGDRLPHRAVLRVDGEDARLEVGRHEHEGRARGDTCERTPRHGGGQSDGEQELAPVHRVDTGGRPGEVPLASEQPEHLARLRVTADLLLREDELPVRDHVELALLALAGDGVEPVGVQLGRETRGPFVVTSSDGAVVDLDLHSGDSSDSGPTSETDVCPESPRVRSKSARKFRITSRTPCSPASPRP
jgi:hypothetical protein